MIDPIADPAMRIEPAGGPDREGDGWRTTWRLANLARTPVRIRGATAPHSQFRGQAALALDVPANGSATFSLVVVVAGVTGNEIENAFLIVLVDIGGSPWRVLARLRVRLDDTGRPSPHVETITVQRVGFSGEL